MKIRKIFVVLLALALLLTACTDDAAVPEVEETEEVVVEEPTEEPTEVPMEEPTEAPVEEPTEEPTPEPTEVPEVVLVDGLGKEFVVEAPYTSIVSLAPSTAESLYAIGAGDTLVGRDDFTYYPEEVLDVPSFGTFWDGVPVETILSMEPDLVIAAEIITPEQIAELEAVGLTVYYQANPLDFEDLYDNLFQLGVLTGHEDEAAVLIDELDARVIAVDEAVAALEGDGPVVFYELDATDPNAPWTAGGGTFIDYLLNKAGCVNAAAELEGDYAMFSSEALIEADPDYILLADAEFGVTVESVTERAGWETITAVVDGNVLPIESSLFSVPGPRLVDGLEFLLENLH